VPLWLRLNKTFYFCPAYRFCQFLKFLYSGRQIFKLCLCDSVFRNITSLDINFFSVSAAFLAFSSYNNTQYGLRSCLRILCGIRHALFTCLKAVFTGQILSLFFPHSTIKFASPLFSPAITMAGFGRLLGGVFSEISNL